MQTLGVIGMGNMGGAIVKGLVSHDVVKLVGHDRTPAKVEALNVPGALTTVTYVDSPEALTDAADIIVLAVKPVQIAPMLERIKSRLHAGKVVVSVAAAVSMSELAAWSGGLCPVVRSMPNLPALVGKGVFALCFDDPSLSEATKACLLDVFNRIGSVFVLPEKQFAAFSAVAGCGPAYACLLMEGMQNAAITLGLSAAQAKEMVAATVSGTAELAATSPESFADLRARVCSPGGMTIYAVNHLERHAVRGHITDAILAARDRDSQMSGK